MPRDPSRYSRGSDMQLTRWDAEDTQNGYGMGTLGQTRPRPQPCTYEATHLLACIVVNQHRDKGGLDFHT
jgi:hypothetical protein